jgi:hypothetical protein
MKTNREKWVCNILYAISVFAIADVSNLNSFMDFVLYFCGIIGIYQVGKYEGEHNL